MKIQLKKVTCSDTTVPSTFVPWKKSGIFPSDRGIFPLGTRIKLDLCFCIIPTVGLYGKLGEVTATHKRTSRMNCRRRVSTAALRRLYCCQSCGSGSAVTAQLSAAASAAAVSVSGSCGSTSAARGSRSCNACSAGCGSAASASAAAAAECWLGQRSGSAQWRWQLRLRLQQPAAAAAALRQR